MLIDRIDPEKFQTFAEINSLINTNQTDLGSLLTKILESAMRLSGGEASSLLLVNQENQRLYFEIALGAKGPDVKRFSLNRGEGIAGWVAEHNISLLVNDVDSDPRFFSDISKAIGFKTQAILAVPMRVHEVCVGVVEIINKRDGSAFVEEDREWLELFANQAALAIRNVQSFQRVRDEVDVLRDQVAENAGWHTVVGSSKAFVEKMELARRVAPTDSSVLILGESGVGKELFAEQVHLHSRRREGPFIRVNCAALPEGLLESELFGHVKGSFTDAVADRRGRFELADGGTIFLDEIAEMAPNVQAKLLRVLQSRSFERVGSSETIRVDVRIIAATNRDIEEAVDSRAFRRDLYYRLNVLPIYVPPLRQRTEDIIELAAHFLKKFNRETNKRIRGFTPGALKALGDYDWPGNVRELENAVERAVVLAAGPEITEEDLVLRGRSGIDERRPSEDSFREAMTDFKRRLIREALAKHRWRQTDAAKALGIQRTYLAKLVKDLDIRR